MNELTRDPIFADLHDPLPESADVLKYELALLNREYVVLSLYSLAASDDDDITDSHTLQFKFSPHTYLHLLPHVPPSHLGSEGVLYLRSNSEFVNMIPPI